MAKLLIVIVLEGSKELDKLSDYCHNKTCHIIRI